LDPKVAVLTVSDSRSAGEAEDVSGPSVGLVLNELGFKHVTLEVVPDVQGQIAARLEALSETHALICTTGGTGFSPRDVTPEATVQMIDRRADNLSELMRAKGAEQTQFSYLSRAVCGMRGSCLIINLPGSPQGAEHGIRSIAHLLGPILSNLGGEGCPV
jgi:molybdenum cofactor synthesis domain-containing protein